MFESKELLRKVDYLNQERSKLWQRLTQLETKVEENTSTHEKNAKQSSKKAAEYKNRAQERRDEVEAIYTETQGLQEKIAGIHNTVEETKTAIDSNKSDIDKSFVDLNSNSETLEEHITRFTEIIEEYPNLNSNIESLTQQLDSTNELSAKISTLQKGITERKTEIDKIYFDIAGYSDEDEETGETKHVEGLKDKLSNQYDELESSIQDVENELETFYETTNKKTEESIKKWNDRYDGIIKKIESLLPNALTAGLSAAYSEKKTNEITNYQNIRKQFNFGILCMIIVSLLSLVISIYFIQTGTSFKEVINLLPKISTSLIPLYIPILWFTFSANKKLNLSKRLIEEYTHKEVISKTFEGLSTQINNFEESEISSELRLKLLYNLLDMSIENPGKLISDYKRVDHPVLEVLNQQSKLDNALEKIKDLPGINRFNELVAKKRVENLEKKKESIENIIEEAKDLIE